MNEHFLSKIYEQSVNVKNIVVTGCEETSDSEVAINDLSMTTLHHWRSQESSAKTLRTSEVYPVRCWRVEICLNSAKRVETRNEAT